jgi:hypothetical protein
MLLFILGNSDFKPINFLPLWKAAYIFCKLKDSVSFAVLYVVFHAHWP